MTNEATITRQWFVARQVQPARLGAMVLVRRRRGRKPLFKWDRSRGYLPAVYADAQFIGEGESITVPASTGG